MLVQTAAIAAGGASSPDLWNVMTAWATVAAAGLVLVQLVREGWRDYVRRRTVNARIEVISYRLRRQLRSWLGQPTTGAMDLERGEDFERWIRDAQNARMLGTHLERAEQRLDELMALRPDAWPKRGRALDRVHVYFLEGTRRLNEYVDTPRPSDEEFFDWIQLRTDAEKDLRECVEDLERHVVAPKTLAAERQLAQRRTAEDPFNQLGDVIVAQHDQPSATRPKDQQP